jgi:predicted GNAT family N-acyltransferase
MYTVIEATTEEQKEALFRLRYNVFYLEQHKYKETADHQKKRLHDDLDDVADQLCLVHNEEIVGSLRQVRGLQRATESMWAQFGLSDFEHFPPEFFGFSGRLMLPKSERGTGALLHLLYANYERGRAAGAVFDFIICNPHLVRLYEQLGYRRYRKHFFDPDHGYNVPMVFLAADLPHLERLRSPFLPVARKWPALTEHAKWFEEHFLNYGSIVSPVLSPEVFVKEITRLLENDNIPLLDGLSPDDRDHFIGASTRLRVESGARITRKGDMGQEIYLILNGFAEAHIIGPSGNKRTIATFGHGDFFGEISVITGEPRTLDVVAVSDVDLIFIDQATLLKFIKSKPTLAAQLLMNVSKVLATRLEAMNRYFGEEHAK